MASEHHAKCDSKETFMYASDTDECVCDRTFAQLVVQELLERFPAGCGLPANAQLAAVQHFLAVNSDLKRLRRSIGAGIAAFDPETASSPKGVFCVVCLLASGSGHLCAPWENASTRTLRHSSEFLHNAILTSVLSAPMLLVLAAAMQNNIGPLCAALEYWVWCMEDINHRLWRTVVIEA